MDSPDRRVLIVANRTAATPHLLDAVKRYAREQPTTFTLLIPDASRSEHSDWTLELALPMLERAAGGRVHSITDTTGDPFDAVRTTLAAGAYDRVLISTLPRRISKWLRRDLPKRVEEHRIDGVDGSLDLVELEPNTFQAAHRPSEELVGLYTDNFALDRRGRS